jgi:L-lactate dehydrogenase complex protein LldG
MPIFKTSRARENILSKVRKNLEGHATPIPYPEAETEPVSGIYCTPFLSDEENFAAAFIDSGGKFIFCDNEQQLLENIYTLNESRGWKEIICTEPRLLQLFQNNNMPLIKSIGEGSEATDACITGCEAVIARTGSIVFSSRQFMGRSSTVFYPAHIVVAYANQVSEDIAPALELMKKRYKGDLPSMINFNTGPSRTADIEKTLVTGVHGPAEVYCFLVNAEK